MIEKDFEGSGRGLIKVIYWNLPGRKSAKRKSKNGNM
jgi:hypothetical protein